MEQDETTLFDFEASADLENWLVVDDGVMGGRSRGEIIPGAKGTALFQGTLSLENNGGFSSVRTVLLSVNLSGYDAIETRVRGDGRTYQFRVRIDERFDGIAYRYDFDTPIDEWITVRLPLREFVPVFRGRVLADAPPLAAGQIRQIGFLLADGQNGPFRLEIDWIKSLRQQ